MTTIEKLSFNIFCVMVLSSMECGKTRNDFLNINSYNIYINLKKDYSEKINKTTGIETKIQHWDGNSKLSMEGISVEYFPTSVDRWR